MRTSWRHRNQLEIDIFGIVRQSACEQSRFHLPHRLVWDAVDAVVYELATDVVFAQGLSDLGEE